MSVHILGNTAIPSAGANDTTENEVAPTLFVTQPSNGYITALHVYVGATSGTIPLQILLVGSGGSLILTTGAQTVGGAGWQTANISPQFIGAGSTQAAAFFFGSGEAHFPVYSGGNFKIGNPSSPSGTNVLANAGSPYFSGNLGSYYEWIDPLTVSGVSPNFGKSGDNVTISGSGFVGGTITSVTFNGIASSFFVNSDSSITATVPYGFTNGTLTVNSDHGSGSTAFSESAPTISSISPSTTSPGQTVTITGYGFTDGSVSSVTIDGISASYSVASNTSITATVPVGAAGVATVTVNTNHGSASYNILVSSARVRRSNAWSFALTVQVRRSSAWASGSGVRVRRSGTWVLGS